MIEAIDKMYITVQSVQAIGNCKEHGDSLTFFCEDDGVFCCSKCAFKYHRQCRSVIEVETMVERNATEIGDLKRDLLELRGKARKMLLQVKRCTNAFTTDASEIQDKIQTVQDQVNEMFENLKNTVTKEITSFKEEAFKMYDAKKTNCDVIVSDVRQVLEELQNISTGNFVSFENVRAGITTRTKQIEDELKDLKQAELSFDFHETMCLPPTESSMPGKLTMRYASLKREDPELNLRLVASVDVKPGGGNREQPLYSGIDFMPDGRIVAVDNMNNNCVVLNQQLAKLGSYSLKDKPLKVAAVSEDEVVITTWNIVFLHVSKDNEITHVRTLVVSQIYESICKIDDETFLVGTLDDPQFIRILSANGVEKEADLSIPMSIYPIGHGACTCTRGGQKVVFTDRYANTVFIYNKGSTETREVLDVDVIKQPCGAAIGPGGTIFVCSNRTNTIVQMSQIGEILDSFELDMEFPSNICISKNNRKLVVSNECEDNIMLQLFEIETYTK